MTFSSNSEENQRMTAITKPAGSSGSEGHRYAGNGVIDEKKRRRMESNRESARRSRKKKQEHLDGLITKVGSFNSENQEFGRKIDHITSALATMEAQNAVLKAEKDRLAARLEALEKSIENVNNNNNNNNNNNKKGYSLINDYEEEEEEESMMKPWQLPCYSLPIAASSAAFRSTNDYYRR